MAEKKLTVKQFLKQFNGYPWDLMECAHEASRITDHPLGDCARTFCIAEQMVEEQLQAIRYEFG